MQSPKVGLQFPTGQLYLQQQGQVAKDKGVQGGGAEAEREGVMGEDDFGRGGRDGVRGRFGPGRWLWTAGTTRVGEDTPFWVWCGEGP